MLFHLPLLWYPFSKIHYISTAQVRRLGDTGSFSHAQKKPIAESKAMRGSVFSL